jgi:hypothetical protein
VSGLFRYSVPVPVSGKINTGILCIPS